MITISVGIFSYWILYSTTDKLSTIVTIQGPKLAKWYVLSELISDTKDHFYDFQSGKIDVIAPVMISVDKAYKAASEIKKLTIEKEEIGKINDFLKNIRIFRQAMSGYASEVREGYKGGISAQEMERIAMKAVVQVTLVSRAAVEDIERRVDKENRHIIEAANISQKILAIGILIAMLLTGFVVFMMNRAIGRPIRKLVDAVIKVAEGDLSVRVDIDTKDEIGQLASVFNRMTSDLAKSKQKLETWSDSLEKEVAVRTKDLSRAKAEIVSYSDTQVTINAILRLSLKNTIFDEFLRQALSRILAIPSFFLSPQGAIFIVNDKTGVLVMRAQRDFPDRVLDKWKTVSLHDNIFTEALLTRQVQFVDCAGNNYQDCDESFGPHRHYCVPILYADKVLGIVVLFLSKDHVKNQNEVISLKQIVDTLGGVIMLKREEDALQAAYQKIKETQIQAEKMSAVGRLATGIAHEVKNPLAVIFSGVQYLPRAFGDKQKTLQVIEEIKTAVQRADSIVRGLLDFSRPTKLQLVTENLNSLLYNSLLLLDKRMKESKIKLVTEYTKDILYVNVDTAKIDQVFLNLFMNAILAMPDGGKLTVRTYTKKLTEYSLSVGRRAEDKFTTGETVAVVEIEDTGCGITEDVIGKLFEPFFTTRRSKGGTGLGLPMVKNIIDMHCGEIYIENKKVGKGVKVTILLKPNA